MDVFMSGGTGYLGRALAERLVARGHSVRILVRAGSMGKVPSGARAVLGDALDGATFASGVRAGGTFVQLTGVAHPAPWKEREFRAVDLVSARESAAVAKAAGVRHFVYVSVAQPAPVMRTYQKVRRECEDMLTAAGLTATILRPWYVVGPGHRWAEALRPAYAVFEKIPATRETALRLGLVTLEQMAGALLWAVEHPPETTRVLDVPGIRGVA
ncbi:MAG: NAD(P)H-binding protein [Acidobacteriota bacterium]